MARVQDRERATYLRKLGYSYSQIKEELKVSKGTLSDWLSKYPLTAKQFALLRKNSQRNKELGIEKFRETMRLKREHRLKDVYEREKRNLLELTKRELWIAGLFLYWGEGSKKINGYIGINNTDPKVIQFSLYWMTKALKVAVKKVNVQLHLYSDMNIDQETKYWSEQLRIPISQFSKPYIKESKRANLTHKGFGHGTCRLVVSNVYLKEKIMMGIEEIADCYSLKI